MTPLTSACSACACLTTLVSASATMKYALASISAGNRSPGTSTSTGRSSRATNASTPARRPPRVRTAGRIPCASSRSSALPCSRVLERLADERLRLSVLLAERSLSELERDDGVHQALLRAVVQIAHHAAAGLVARGEQTRPRGGELVAAVGVRDRGVEQSGELSHPLLGVGRRCLLALPVCDRRRPRAGRRRRSAPRRSRAHPTCAASSATAPCVPS